VIDSRGDVFNHVCFELDLDFVAERFRALYFELGALNFGLWSWSLVFD
jgi:hypothetical protein